MSKMDEFFGRRLEHSVELGKANAECIRNAQNWCKHLRLEMVSAGMVAHMYRLPVGLHEISCQYAKQKLGSSNLPWTIPTFIVDNCVDCPHHDSGGSTAWGDQVIADHQRQVEARQKADLAHRENLAKLRARLRELPRQARDASQVDERQILVFTEELFADDESQQQVAAERLVQSARIGAELFPPIVTDILLDQSGSEPFAALCLPVCAELAAHRADLADRLAKVAFSAIEHRVGPELAAGVLIPLGDNVKYPLSSLLVERLITHQNHVMPLGGGGAAPPTYPNTTAILLKCYDSESASVTTPLRSFLHMDNKYARIQICGVIGLLQTQRPQIGIDLLPDLVSSFGLGDDPYQESADASARRRILKAFRYSPTHVDQHLVSQLQQQRPAVQEEIVVVYREASRNRNKDWHDTNRRWRHEAPPPEAAIAVARCLEFIKDDSLDVDVRWKAAESLCTACSNYPQAVLPHLDSVLGYYAILCTQDNPPPLPPRIILPGEQPDDPVLKNLTEGNRRQHWAFFKEKILDCMKELAEIGPATVGERVIECYERLDTRTHASFKSAIVELLGEIGKDYSLQPKVLPLMMKALVDYGSQRLSTTALT